MPVTEQNPTEAIFETRLPEHRHSAAAINRLGDRAVLTSIENREQNASLRDARLFLDISLSDEKYNGFTDIREETEFVAGLGISVPRTEAFFVNEDVYRKLKQNSVSKNKHSIAHYGADQERIYLNTSHEDSTGLDKEITKVLYVHELAHASSYWGPFPSVDKKTDKVTYPRARMGLSTAREHEGRLEERGELLEEAFAYYVQGQYVKHKGLNFREFIEGSMHNDQYMAVEMEDHLGIVAHPDSGLMQASLEDKLRVIKTATENNNIVLYPWYFVQGEKPSNVAYNLPSAVGMAFELIIEDDPSFFEALKTARHEAGGLRQVAQKLDSLKPGLYKRLRDLEQTPDDIFNFYKSVVDALSDKHPEKLTE